MIKVMLVDDHTVLRDGIRSILDIEEDLLLVGEADSGESLMKVLDTTIPDVIVLDINLPNKNGIELISPIKEKHPGCKILILTMFDHDEYFKSALREGADGYLLKDASSMEVIDAIRKIHQGNSIIHPKMASKLISYHRLQNDYSNQENELTNREKEVLNQLVRGKSNKEIAAHLSISDKTVKIHVNKIYKKLNVNSRSQAIIYAVQNKLVPYLN
ncbi:response regulator [Mesobacillus subterraneus]|uniref:DNA-binding response regulator n=1 Tax=Mesobacillus subterraneus TaxID=285983 RepID=A0A427TNE9_9BACI|nr:response regulator transcription factor [Mesobacillus subterraneus]RSD25885.1 DNA-binding response regulator [Mesobacillus subterraneus]